jgi:hypothetical protein
VSGVIQNETNIRGPSLPPMRRGVRLMEHRSPQHDASVKQLINRLDPVLREMNAVLLVLAIGLAALDVTGFVAVAVRDAAPSVARFSVDPSEAAKRASSLGPSVAVPAPTKPGAAIAGR